MTKELPSPELLRKILRYEPDTGKLFWRKRTSDIFSSGSQSAEHNCARWNAKLSGKEAFLNNHTNGYRQSSIFDKPYFAHRVIWAIHYGTWPDKEIDHINGDRADNRIINLRCATRSQNARNVARSPRNTSGVMGVSWCRKSKKWHARIKYCGKTHHLGLFNDLHEAACVRAAAEKEFGFHPNHGRSAL